VVMFCCSLPTAHSFSMKLAVSAYAMWNRSCVKIISYFRGRAWGFSPCWATFLWVANDQYCARCCGSSHCDGLSRWSVLTIMSRSRRYRVLQWRFKWLCKWIFQFTGHDSSCSRPTPCELVNDHLKQPVRSLLKSWVELWISSLNWI
jgi:hypothetical protein